MKKLFTLLIMVLFVCSVQAQRPTGEIQKTTVAPVIDGELDEVWDNANVYDIDKPYSTEVPTIGAAGETTWRALWDEDGMYVFIEVNDDAWYPSYLSLGNAWEADKPEVYFDVNYILEDGVGASAANSGHFQVSPTPVLALIDGTPTTETNGVIWSFKVADPAYTVEYFVPWSHLVDKEGVQFDKTGTMGFDVTIIDRDPGDTGRRRAVWANVGAQNESWSNMDDVGYITLLGAEPNTLIDQITITGGNAISKNKGSLQLSAAILPEDATIKTLSWVIENTPGQTGMATVDNTGRVKAIADGEITVFAKATDGSYEEASVVITLSNQKPTRWDLSQLRNGLLNDVDAGGNAVGWGGWIDGTGTRTLVDGVFVNEVTSVGMDGENIVGWRFQTGQEPVFRPAVNDVPYKLSFTAWAAADRKIGVNFEDPNNGYARYGASADPRSAGGRSEWSFDLTTEPQRFEVDVTFDGILENTFQKFIFTLSTEVGTVYLDSILLISDANLAAAYPDDTYAMYTVNFGVKEVEGAANGTLTAKVDDVDIVAGADVQEQKTVVFTATPTEGYKVKQWTNRGVVIAGQTDVTYTTNTTDELDIMVEFEVATSIDNNVLSNLRVYPNPFNNTINIRNAENVKRVSITNIVGQRILDMEVNGETTIDTGSFNTGVYFMIFEGNNGQRLVQKMIKR